ncbi:hypothetical protein NHF48_004205 [Sphingomonas sp. H160509]|uniref:hypothetical protein n=1 Tax=Sphingomonas sp. H160509 TaxID=2955313 RepID=UPI0020986721|nr:hypothetical protein [Sphingomonas sp. H160509]
MRGASWISASELIELVVIDVLSLFVPRATAVTTMSSCGTSAAGAAGVAAGLACGAVCAAPAVANDAAAMPASNA